MKFASERPYTDPEAAARKLIEIANQVEGVQDGRIYIGRKQVERAKRKRVLGL